MAQETEIGKTVVQAQSRQEPISTNDWEQWCMPVTPAIWEA
jgi:hypothetical protein